MNNTITNSKTTNNRNIGIDALRILSMFYVIILHILGHGGILDNAIGINHYIVTFINVFSDCAVDIFILISGYVGYSEHKHSSVSTKFLTLWSQVFFYSFGIALCFILLNPGTICIKDLIRSLFPVASDQYWFFSNYVPLLFLMPFLNGFIKNVGIKGLTKLVAVIFVLFSVYMVFVARLGTADPFLLYYGYSAIWFISLYIIGAWIKCINLQSKVKIKTSISIILLCVVISWLFKFVFTGLFQTSALVSYTSPTVLITAIAYLIIFSKLEIGPKLKKWIAFFAPSAFGVYLIHDNNLIRRYFISRYFNYITTAPAYLLILEVLGCALGILFAGMLIEKLRQLLFKALKINKYVQRAGEKIDSYIQHLFTETYTNHLL